MRSQFLALAVALGLLVAVSGCGGGRAVRVRASLRPPATIVAGPSGGSAMYAHTSIVDVQRSIEVSNPGTRFAFSAFLSQRIVYSFRGEMVQIASVQTTPIAFSSHRSQAAWMRTKPQLSEVGSHSTVLLKESQFSLLGMPGTPVTFSEVAPLEGHPMRITALVRAAVGAPGARSHSQTLFDAFGHLLALGSLSRAARGVIAQAMLSVPGAKQCGYHSDAHNRGRLAACVTSGYLKERIVLAEPSDRVVEIVQSLTRATPLYTDVRAGQTVESDRYYRSVST